MCVLYALVNAVAVCVISTLNLFCTEMDLLPLGNI